MLSYFLFQLYFDEQQIAFAEDYTRTCKTSFSRKTDDESRDARITLLIKLFLPIETDGCFSLDLVYFV